MPNVYCVYTMNTLMFFSDSRNPVLHIIFCEHYLPARLRRGRVRPGGCWPSAGGSALRIRPDSAFRKAGPEPIWSISAGGADKCGARGGRAAGGLMQMGGVRGGGDS